MTDLSNFNEKNKEAHIILNEISKLLGQKSINIAEIEKQVGISDSTLGRMYKNKMMCGDMNYLRLKNAYDVLLNKYKKIEKKNFF